MQRTSSGPCWRRETEEEDVLQDDQRFLLEQPLHTTKWSWVSLRGPESPAVPMELGLGL